MHFSLGDEAAPECMHLSQRHTEPHSNACIYGKDIEPHSNACIYGKDTEPHSNACISVRQAITIKGAAWSITKRIASGTHDERSHTMAEYAEANADRCITLFDRDRLCITQLWAFAGNLWDFLDTNEVGTKLKSFIERETGMGKAEVSHPAFQNRVKAVFGERGIQNLCPENRVEAYTKDETLRLLAAAGWSEPYTPVMLQMRPGPFIAVQNAQAAFWLIENMIRTGQYRMKNGRIVKVGLLYEMQIDNPCRVILDCEAYLDHFGGRLTMEQLVRNLRRVPQAFARRLVELGAIPRQSVVRMVEKNKGEGRPGKATMHFISNVVSNPKGAMRMVLAKIYIESLEGVRKQLKDSKSMAHVELDADGLFDPALVVDVCTIKGSHQFSVMGSKKEGEVDSRLVQCFVISNRGQEEEVVESPFKDIVEFATHPNALSMLFQANFTHWMPDSIPINREFGIMAPTTMRISSHAVPSVVRRSPCRETRTHAHPFGGREKEGPGVGPVPVPVAPLAGRAPCHRG